MNTTLLTSPRVAGADAVLEKRSVARLLAPLDALAENSRHLSYLLAIAQNI